MELDVLSIKTPFMMTHLSFKTLPPDFVDGRHLDWEDDTLEGGVLSKSCFYDGFGCPELGLFLN